MTTVGWDHCGPPGQQNADNLNALIVPRQELPLWNENTVSWTKLTLEGFEVQERNGDVPSNAPRTRFSEISCTDAATAASYVRGLLALPELSGKRTVPLDSLRDVVDCTSPDFEIFENWIMGIWSRTDSRHSPNRRIFPANSLSVRELIENTIADCGTGAGSGNSVSDSFAACVEELARAFLGDDAFVLQNGAEDVDHVLIPSFKFLHDLVWKGEYNKQNNKIRRGEKPRGRGGVRRGKGKGKNRATGKASPRTRVATPAKRRGPGRPPKRLLNTHNLRRDPPASARSKNAAGSKENPYDVSDTEDVKMENADQTQSQLRYPDPSSIAGPSNTSQLTSRVDNNHGNGVGGPQSIVTGTSERSQESPLRLQPASTPHTRHIGANGLAGLIDSVNNLTSTDLGHLDELIQLKKRQQQEFEDLQRKWLTGTI